MYMLKYAKKLDWYLQKPAKVLKSKHLVIMLYLREMLKCTYALWTYSGGVTHEQVVLDKVFDNFYVL